MEGPTVCTEVGTAYRCLVSKPEEKRPVWKSENDRIVILKWILDKYGVWKSDEA
jgi:hypothetical protein